VTDISMQVLQLLDETDISLDDQLREILRVYVQALIDAEVTKRIGAEPYERSEERVTQRNGYRDRVWQTRLGEVSLAVPKLREGTYFPSFLEPRRMAEKALLAAVQTAYVQGVSTRRVEQLMETLGWPKVDKSQVSRICKALDEAVRAFRERPLAEEYPYIWLDATYLKVRQNHRIVSMAGVVAIGVRATGDREVLGFEVGASEEASFWMQFLRKLVERGLHGVQLVISDAHLGLKAAVCQVLAGATWQRCRVHLMRNVLAHVSKGGRTIVAAHLRIIYAQQSQSAAGDQLEQVADMLEAHWPRAAAVLREAKEDALAYMAFPQEHWSRIYSTNPLERLNKEIKRRTDVVGIFPDVASTERLVGAILAECHDEWQTNRRYFSQESMRKLLAPEDSLSIPAPVHLEPIHERN
jgi:putative transposase